MNHNPDIPENFIATTNIDLLRTAGNNLEKELMKLHRNFHGPECSTCEALGTWWTINGR
jgi:NAD-dependent SIR2 family protein deacetylase